MQLRAFFQENRRTLLIEEALFGVAFLFFLFVRFGNPDLWHPVMGGEKPMDFAYLNAVIKSQYFPPYDPWFAGGQITYYYFGFVLIAALVKLLGIMPSIAYNFAIPTLFALTALGAFCVAFNLVQAFGRWVHDRIVLAQESDRHWRDRGRVRRVHGQPGRRARSAAADQQIWRRDLPEHHHAAQASGRYRAGRRRRWRLTRRS